MELTLKAQIAK